MRDGSELFLSDEIQALYENNEPTREALRELRDEFNKPSFRKKLVEAHGCKCVVCGTTEDVQFHHVLPLACGGNNNIGNIVPMCHVHHMLTHHANTRKKYKQGANKNMGRRREIPENYEQILDDYLHCRISMSELCKKFGWTETARKLSDRIWFKEYLSNHRITGYRNNLDVIMASGILAEGKKCGHLEFSDGSVEEFYVSHEYYMSHTTKEYRKQRIRLKDYTTETLLNARCPVCGKMTACVGEKIDEYYVPRLHRRQRYMQVVCNECKCVIGTVLCD